MMRRQRTPLVLITIAGILGGGVYWSESRKMSPTIQPSGQVGVAASQPIVDAQERDIEALSIKTSVQTIVLNKVPSTSPSATSGPIEWMIRSPTPEGPASDASVAFLTNLLVGKSERLLSVAGTKRAEFGFDHPLATIEVRLPNQTIQTIVLGHLNFNRTGLYAALNPPTDPNAAFPVVLVSPNFEQAVTRSIGEWRSAKLKTPAK